MKQKLFTLLTLLVFICTGAWGGEVTYTYFKVANSVLYGASAKSTASPAVEGFVLDQVEFSLIDPSTSAVSVPTAGSGQLKIPASSAKGLVISAHGKTITKIEMSSWKNAPSGIKVDEETLTCTDGKVTWTGSATSVTFYNTEGSERQFGTLTVTYDGEFLDGISSTTLSSLARSGYSENSIYNVNYSTSPTAYGLALNALNANSSMKLTNSTGKLTLKSIKPISSVVITWDNATDVTVGGEAITKDTEKKTNTWTAPNTTTDEVAFVNASASGNHTPQSILVNFVSTDPTLTVSPSTAESFSYVVGNGPSDAQSFTVTGENLTDEDITVSLYAGDTYYEISKDGLIYGTSNLTVASGDAVYVRLKAGISLGADYAGTLRFANDDADNVDIDLSGSVTNQTYTVTYELNGASGDAPTETEKEEDEVFALAAAPTRDCYTFDGWLCNVDGVTYAAGDDYTMTAAPTTFTAQWTAIYSSSLDFAAVTLAKINSGTTPPAITTFLSSGNMIASDLGSSAWETGSDWGGIIKTGFLGYKLKDNGAKVSFLAKAGKLVTIVLGSVGASVTLSKNGVTSTISSKSGDNAETVVTPFVAGEDMLISLTTTSTNTVTLKKILIQDYETVSVTSAGYATYCSENALDFTYVPSLTAYTASVDEDKVVFTEAGEVPAEEGLMLKADEGSYNVPNIASAAAVTNVFVGKTVETVVNEPGIYVLYNGGNGIGFYRTTAPSFTIKAHSAYIPSDVVSARAFIGFDDETTGIASMTKTQTTQNQEYYNLAGQRVAQPARGLYIVNGKKVIIK